MSTTAAALAHRSPFTQAQWQDALDALGGHADDLLPTVERIVASLGYWPLSAAQRLLGFVEDPMTQPTAAPVLTVRVMRDRLDGGFVVSAAEAPGCMSQGETITAALEDFTEAFTDWAIARALRGMEVPGMNRQTDA